MWAEGFPEMQDNVWAGLWAQNALCWWSCLCGYLLFSRCLFLVLLYLLVADANSVPLYLPGYLKRYLVGSKSPAISELLFFLSSDNEHNTGQPDSWRRRLRRHDWGKEGQSKQKSIYASLCVSVYVSCGISFDLRSVLQRECHHQWCYIIACYSRI